MISSRPTWAHRPRGARMKVAVLGCGSVGSQVVRLLGEQADDLAARIGAPRRAGRRRRTPHRRAARGRRPRRAAHHRRRRPRRPRRRRPRRRGDRRHRARPHADPLRARARRSRSSPPTRRCSPRTARRSSRRRTRPSATSTTRPRSPARSRSCGRCASPRRRPRHPGARHRQRHHQLHPRPDGQPGAGFDEALEEAQELGYAEADPTADVEGFDAAAKAAILAWLAFHTRVTAADVHREGISRGDRRRRRVGARTWTASSSCWPIARARRGRRGRRPRAPRDDPAHAPAGRRCARRSTRSSSSPRPPAS